MAGIGALPAARQNPESPAVRTLLTQWVAIRRIVQTASIGLPSRFCRNARFRDVNRCDFGRLFSLSRKSNRPVANPNSRVRACDVATIRRLSSEWVYLIQRNRWATPAQFTVAVASTTAHEIGHMMGLRHATSGPANNIMVPGRGRANNFFPNQAVYTEGGGPQNAHHELWYSLRNPQPTQYQIVSRGVPDPAIDHLHDHAANSLHDGDDVAMDRLMDENGSHDIDLLPVQGSGPCAHSVVDQFFAGFKGMTEPVQVPETLAHSLKPATIAGLVPGNTNILDASYQTRDTENARVPNGQSFKEQRTGQDQPFQVARRESGSITKGTAQTIREQKKTFSNAIQTGFRELATVHDENQTLLDMDIHVI